MRPLGYRWRLNLVGEQAGKGVCVFVCRWEITGCAPAWDISCGFIIATDVIAAGAGKTLSREMKPVPIHERRKVSTTKYGEVGKLPYNNNKNGVMLACIEL